MRSSCGIRLHFIGRSNTHVLACAGVPTQDPGPRAKEGLDAFEWFAPEEIKKEHCVALLLPVLDASTLWKRPCAPAALPLGCTPQVPHALGKVSNILSPGTGVTVLLPPRIT